MNQDRRERACRIIEALSDFPELSFQTVPEGRVSSWHLLAARYDGRASGRTRDDLIEILAFRHRVQVVVQYYPLYRYPMFRKAGFGEADCPNTDAFFDNMVSFPFHHGLTERQIDYMIDAIRTALTDLRGK
jgi:dTDP-4-amino-4,6-dideoxygalactose transaminase